MCDRCDLRVTLAKSIKVGRAPSLLCIGLKRNVFDPSRQRMIKLSHHIDTPVRIDLTPYLAFPCPAQAASRIACDAAALAYGGKVHVSAYQGWLKYQLVGKVVHHGSAEGGANHYTAYRRCFNAAPRPWVHANDANVRAVCRDAVLGSCGSLLFYEIVPF